MGARGEGRLQSGDKTIRILFTNRAIAEAEVATGKTVLQMAQGLRDGNLGMNDVAHLLAAGMEQERRDQNGPGPRITAREAFKIIDEVGFVAALEVVMQCLTDVLSYNPGRETDADPI